MFGNKITSTHTSESRCILPTLYSHTTNFFIDDGLRPTLISSFITSIKHLFNPVPEISNPITEEPDLSPNFLTKDEALIAFTLSLPESLKTSSEEIHRLLVMLSFSNYSISFELIASHNEIKIQFVCRESDLLSVQDQIKAFYPQTSFLEGSLDDILPEGKDGFIIDFGLKDEFMRSLLTYKNFDLDPYVGLFGILETLKENEQATIQILFKGVENMWAESILRSVKDNNGDSFFLDAPEMVRLAEEKISGPLFGVVIRVITLNSRGDNTLIKRLAQAIVSMTSSPYNELIPLLLDDYDPQAFCEDVILRQSHRSGMLLNCTELASLIHFPSISMVSRKLKRNRRKTKEIPEIFIGHKLLLGVSVHQGESHEVTISHYQRLKHMHVIGATGTGKSTMLLNMIRQDIRNGEGIAVIDPHGDLIESLIACIPENRHKEVILFDPADIDYPIGFNILTAHSEIEKNILASDLVAIFKRLSLSWGDQMNSVFANAILAFLENDQGGTLIDLRRFLLEKDFREKCLKSVKDQSIVYYWTKEFPLLKSTSIGPILTRLDAFLRPKVIRNLVAQKKSLNFERILDDKSILLIKLPQGLIGEENSYLLGAFLVSKLQQAAMARQAKAQAERSNFYVYIDEFQNFITPSMSTILSGARKYHLGLVLAHQDMRQLTKNDSELAGSVLSNAGTRICFRLGDADAHKFEGNFSYFDAFDLQNLNTGEAIIRIERPDNDCNLDTIPFKDPEPEVAHKVKTLVIAASRAAYGTPREEVELYLELIKVPMQQIRPEQENGIIQPKLASIPKEELQIPTILSKTSEIIPKIKKQETQHRYLQTLIKKMAESRGYRASIEEVILDGKGRVDVSLERNNKKIAIEIKDTTDDKWELGNIDKCLLAGYDNVIECSNDLKTIDRLRTKVDTKFDDTQKHSIQVLNPEDIFLFLDSEIAREASNETRVKGYRVKVEYSAITESEANRIKETITKSVVSALKKKLD